ncbi:hypothetical protein BLNAU_3376 [Blattamonas nauphoetae]|uniref:Uncharacterized protein n=1 Tax=Blattamonas nauphoetae TaxID=2049346 RepID=A0ABQ9YCT8_9EUKA|nr:hypothetical protein BLNAU_3376 [Blattamonas nauphoetae]
MVSFAGKIRITSRQSPSMVTTLPILRRHSRRASTAPTAQTRILHFMKRMNIRHHHPITDSSTARVSSLSVLPPLLFTDPLHFTLTNTTITRTGFVFGDHGQINPSTVLMEDNISHGIVSVTITMQDCRESVYFGLLDSSAPVPTIHEAIGRYVENSVSLTPFGNLLLNTPNMQLKRIYRTRLSSPIVDQQFLCTLTFVCLVTTNISLVLTNRSSTASILSFLSPSSPFNPACHVLCVMSVAILLCCVYCPPFWILCDTTRLPWLSFL